MQPDHAQAAATLLWNTWQQGKRLAALPPDCRPASRGDGYAVQAALAQRSGQAVRGWKIAATSAAGQAHIGVDGPLAGRLLASRLLDDGAAIKIAGNAMKVFEVEFAFRMATDLPRRAAPWTQPEVMAAVASLHPAIEIPDSRYDDFVQAGQAQLIADNACACWVMFGPAVSTDWRSRDLAAHAVSASVNGRQVAQGAGRNALGDPRIALTWIANELATHDDGLKAGQLVITGTCVTPVPVLPGDAAVADWGDFGRLSVSFVA